MPKRNEYDEGEARDCLNKVMMRMTMIRGG